MVPLVRKEATETAYLKIKKLDLKSELPSYSEKKRANSLVLEEEHANEHLLVLLICWKKTENSPQTKVNVSKHLENR
jgi:hypothetical protein